MHRISATLNRHVTNAAHDTATQIDSAAPAQTGPPPTRIAPTAEPTLREFVALVVLVAMSSMAMLPMWLPAVDFSFAHSPRMRGLSIGTLEFFRTIALSINAGQGLILGAAGLWLAAWIGMNPFRLLTLRSWDDLRPQLRPLLTRCAGMGGVLFLITTLVAVPQLIFLGLNPPHGVNAGALSKHNAVVGLMTQMVSPKGALALIFGAPVFEEMEFRLFLLSLIAWLSTKVGASRDGKPSRAGLWCAVIVSGLVFGLGHVVSSQSVGWWRPWYVLAFTDPRSYVGMVLGYVYWRWGLESSIGAHCVLNVLVVGIAAASVLVSKL